VVKEQIVQGFETVENASDQVVRLLNTLVHEQEKADH